MIRQPDVILLDEATSALDMKNERIVQEALDKLAQWGSALVVAHRLTTIQDSDKIIVVDEGAKVEEGVHHELLLRDPPKKKPAAPGSPPVLSRQLSAGEESPKPAAPLP